MKRLGIVTALMAEAIVLIDYYRLTKKVRPKGQLNSFHLFQSDAIDLLIAGPGPNAMRRGLNDYFLSLQSNPVQTWLNVGIAGSLEHALGELIWADMIAGVKIGLPDDVINKPQINVKSLSRPSTNYQVNCLFDMEAETILQMIVQNSTQFTLGDLFCAKVISDNQYKNGHDFNKLWVTDLMRKQVKTLDHHINKFINL